MIIIIININYYSLFDWNRNLPLTAVFFSIIFWLCGILDGTTPTMFISGLIVSWIYLRFYQRHANGNRGDGSESFTFARFVLSFQTEFRVFSVAFFSYCFYFVCSFFPNILQPAIAVLVNPLHKLFLSIGIIKPHVSSRNSAHSLTSVVSPQSVDMHDMERRRQIALKALSERLSRTTDPNRQKLLPKAFPSHHHGHGHHSHGGHQSFNDSNQPSFIAPKRGPMMEFEIPAIPLPAPPSMAIGSNQTQNDAVPSSGSQTLIDIGNMNESSSS